MAMCSCRYLPAADQPACTCIVMVSVGIAAVNDAPVASSGSLNATENTAVNGFLSASDIDGDALIYNLTSNAVKGSVVISNTSTDAYTYTPDTGATGTDSFSYRVSDGEVDSKIAIVTIQLQQVNVVNSNSGGSVNLLFVLLLSLLSGASGLSLRAWYKIALFFAAEIYSPFLPLNSR